MFVLIDRAKAKTELFGQLEAIPDAELVPGQLFQARANWRCRSRVADFAVEIGVSDVGLPVLRDAAGKVQLDPLGPRAAGEDDVARDEGVWCGRIGAIELE